MRYLVVLLLLASCASQPKEERWARVDGGGSQPQLTADDGACKSQAFGVPGAMGNMLQVAAVYSTCMQGKGWHRE